MDGYDWVLYFDNKEDFSESFKIHLSNQLRNQLDAQLGRENVLDEYFFNLFIGMRPIDLKVIDNYVFANADIISPDSSSREITICWTSDGFENKLAIHRAELLDDQTKFFFCTDFPNEELLKYIGKKDKSKRTTAASGLNFTAETNLSGFPDLSVTFDTLEALNEEEQSQIEAAFQSGKNIYVSGFRQNSIVLDFQIDSAKKDQPQIKLCHEYLADTLQKINSLSFSPKIVHIKIQ